MISSRVFEYCQRANTLLRRADFAGALAALEQALALEPQSAILHLEQGKILFNLRRDADSLGSFGRALSADPGLVAARIERSRALLRLGNGNAALATIEQVLTEDAGNARAHGIRAQILLIQGRLADALEAAKRSHFLDPNEPVAFMVRGFVYLRRMEPVRALEELDAAIGIDPSLAIAHLGRGQALTAVNRFTDACKAYARVCQLDPSSAVPHVRIGFLLIQTNQFETAVDAFDRALLRNPGELAALQGRAQCLAAVGRSTEAIEAYTKLLSVSPNADYMRGELFHVQMQCCDWRDFEANREDIESRVRRGERVDFPGSFNTHSESPADQLICARTFANDFLVVHPRTVSQAPRPRSNRIRVAYLSADFCAHPTAYLAAGLFEAHNRSQFDIHALSFGPNDGSAMRSRLERAFEHFIDAREFNNDKIVEIIEELGIDIAVDVKGHTLGARPAIFAARPAPIQVSFLAYPGTLGADFMDYIVADQHVIPEQEQAHYAEKVIYLPGSYQVNDSLRTAGQAPTRAEAGLPEGYFIFCCFNGSYKITPAVFNLWMKILAAVPQSILWLLEGPPQAVQNLRREAATRGLDERRLVFAARQSAGDHLARCALADLFLDTYPYNAHTTASDALWAGVPVLTRPGPTFASRVATSLLHAVNCAQLSVPTSEEYVRVAIELASDPKKLADLKAHIRRARSDARLFDTNRYTQELETAYTEIWDRHQRGERPSVLWVNHPRPIATRPILP